MSEKSPYDEDAIRRMLEEMHRRIEEIWDENEPVESFPPLDEQKCTAYARYFFSRLEQKTRHWVPRKIETIRDGNILKTYQTTIRSGNDPLWFDVQLMYNPKIQPLFANVGITGINRLYSFLEEHYAQVDLLRVPHIYYSRHPFHHEDSGRKQIDNIAAPARIDALIDRLSMEN